VPAPCQQQVLLLLLLLLPVLRAALQSRHSVLQPAPSLQQVVLRLLLAAAYRSIMARS
jgi:hypothetical protein